MMVNEIQGQIPGPKKCREFLYEVDCHLGTCTTLCLQKFKGIGQCIKVDDKTLICLCNYDCKF